MAEVEALNQGRLRREKMPKFDIDAYQKKILAKLHPPVGSPIISKLREAALKRKQPRV